MFVLIGMPLHFVGMVVGFHSGWILVCWYWLFIASSILSWIICWALVGLFWSAAAVRALAINSVLISIGWSVIVMGVSCSVVPCGVRRVIWSLPWVSLVSRVVGVVIFRVVPAWVMVRASPQTRVLGVVGLQGSPSSSAAVRVQPLLHIWVRSSLYWLYCLAHFSLVKTGSGSW